MNDGYAICFNEWALDKEIKSDLGLLIIISSLTAETGYCFANNKYLAEIFKTTEVSISRKIKNLEDKKYITIEYEKQGCQVKSRKIRLTKMLIDDYQKCKSTINKNVKENNTSINITRINNNNTTTIYDLVENEFGRPLSQIEFEQISQWEDNELTRYAIKQAILNNKRSIKYIDKIIYNYKQANIKSIAEAQQNEEEYRNKLEEQKRNRENFYKSKTKGNHLDEVIARLRKEDEENAKK